ncbi:MAG: ATP synthase F1 subunit epsilon [Flammeovirgaceae bacterium]|nr:ATP synthase F1 subunit epsilon [Flammeovirgaceae bacterium]|tara:strand:+ start:585 stop:821 length:237 start_codon:yes stop_codon:yes gene_type:complete
MFLEILSAEEKIFSGEVDSVILPGTDGQFQILNNHAPIISSLTNGEIKYSDKSKNETLEINGGIVEVLDNKVSALIEK